MVGSVLLYEGEYMLRGLGLVKGEGGNVRDGIPGHSEGAGKIDIFTLLGGGDLEGWREVR